MLGSFRMKMCRSYYCLQRPSQARLFNLNIAVVGSNGPAVRRPGVHLGGPIMLLPSFLFFNVNKMQKKGFTVIMDVL